MYASICASYTSKTRTNQNCQVSVLHKAQSISAGVAACAQVNGDLSSQTSVLLFIMILMLQEACSLMLEWQASCMDFQTQTSLTPEAQVGCSQRRSLKQL
jgi:hypothetical protein